MSMTLEEAIVHAEDTAKSAIGCECREEHRQLAEWLKELDKRRKLKSTQPEYEPVTAEDLAKTMSETSTYSYMAWYSEALSLMKRTGFVICKKVI